VVVDDEGRPQGVARATELAGVSPALRERVRVSELGERLQKDMAVVGLDESARAAADRALLHNVTLVVVAPDGAPAGIVARGDVERYLELHAMDSRHAQRGWTK